MPARRLALRRIERQLEVIDCELHAELRPRRCQPQALPFLVASRCDGQPDPSAADGQTHSGRVARRHVTSDYRAQADGLMRTIPLVPSTSTIWPSWMVVV